jgi:hypothetical protein
MSSFNTSTSHPIIPNSNQYYVDQKYVSIHSEDRDILRFQQSSDFEIELPQDYLNVQSVTLSSWSFPANYNVFSPINFNIGMSFRFVNAYNPGANSYSDPLAEAIFAAIYNNIDTQHIILIETGFYSPDQMATELTNKFNSIITNFLQNYFDNTPAYNYATALLVSAGGYDRFNIVYNAVGQRLWFGNTADQFEVTNNYDGQVVSEIINSQCVRKNVLPSLSNWGLPSYLGFTRCPATALSAAQVNANQETIYNTITGLFPGNDVNLEGTVPRFYYGNVSNGDDGYWLLPTLPGAVVYFLQAPAKINFMGPAFMYLEIDGLNCIDETSPFNVSQFTSTTNQTNSRVNSSFAKIPIPSTPISQWFDNSYPPAPYKYFNPPAERIRKLKIKLRYHNGQQVDFGLFEYSFLLQFTLLRPQSERKYTIVQ